MSLLKATTQGHNLTAQETIIGRKLDALALASTAVAWKFSAEPVQLYLAHSIVCTLKEQCTVIKAQNHLTNVVPTSRQRN